MMEAELYKLIGQYGFPIMMCVWFMLRTEKIINRNTDAINTLSKIVETQYNERRKSNP